jgi:predicted glycosyltransferase involved in capsule biosynthesis
MKRLEQKNKINFKAIPAKKGMSLIAIVDLINRPKDLIKKLKQLCKILSDSEFNLVICHRNRALKFDQKLEELFSRFNQPNFNFFSVILDKPNVELSRLRNLAVDQVETEFVLLIDLDIYPDMTLFRNLAEKVLKREKFSIAPCIYLTNKGSRFAHTLKKEELIEKCMNFSDDIYMHWAIPSSVMAFRKDDFLSIGGFFEGYLDHGYEDFDFIVRLACHHGVLSKTSQLLIDKTYRASLLSEGFRSSLGSLCIDNLLEGNIAFHLYHYKDENSEYYKQRINNSMIFNKRMQQLIRDSKPSSKSDKQTFVPPLISTFFQECKRRNIDPSKYYTLFDARPRYLLRPNSKWKRLKNLFNF